MIDKQLIFSDKHLAEIFYGDESLYISHIQANSLIREQAQEIERLREADRWIPVEERLPTNQADVLVDTIYKEVEEQIVASYSGWAWVGLGLRAAITWKPLPAPYAALSSQTQEKP